MRESIEKKETEARGRSKVCGRGAKGSTCPGLVS